MNVTDSISKSVEFFLKDCQKLTRGSRSKNFETRAIAVASRVASVFFAALAVLSALSMLSATPIGVLFYLISTIGSGAAAHDLFVIGDNLSDMMNNPVTKMAKSAISGIGSLFNRKIDYTHSCLSGTWAIGPIFTALSH